MKSSVFGEVKALLEEKVKEYNQSSFLRQDPISIPHLFQKKQDIEIAGFLTATIAWGQRPTILKNANWLVRQMDLDPHAFILNHSVSERDRFSKFVHRTFNGTDCMFFLESLQNIYSQYSSLEDLFLETDDKSAPDYLHSIMNWRSLFFTIPSPIRTQKHFSNPSQGSASKRINMFLRWMIRSDTHGVDFGIWKNADPSRLICPLDVHSGRVARKLKLLARPANDWKAAIELTQALRKMDSADPVKYDFALFGLGAFERF